MKQEPVMKKGELLLNWQKEPVVVYLGDNKAFCIKNQETYSYSNKQMLALFYQENGLQGADLEGVDLRFANLSGADLSGVDLRGADLSGVDLRGADLYCANLYGANLAGVNLAGVNLSGADLRNVMYNRYTTWPEGFDESRLYFLTK
jgi:uncharacterized protein YjbI with pentapeptide repeats